MCPPGHHRGGLARRVHGCVPPRQGDAAARHDPAARIHRPSQPSHRLRRRDAGARHLDRALRRVPHLGRRHEAVHEAPCRDSGRSAPAVQRRGTLTAGRAHADRGRPGPLLPRPARPGRGQLGPPGLLQLRHHCDARLGRAPAGRSRGRVVRPHRRPQARRLRLRAVGRHAGRPSLQVGKLADLVELSEDPYTVDPRRITEDVSVLGTWLGGRRIDLDSFESEVAAMDPTPHRALAKPRQHACC